VLVRASTPAARKGKGKGKGHQHRKGRYNRPKN
jgi:hypothetical protein